MSTINIYGTIGVDVTPQAFARQLDSMSEPVTVYINSFGGDAYAGIAIANRLSTYQNKVTAIVEGIAASAASIILTGADEVHMYPSAEIMIHEATIDMGGNSEQLAASSAQLDQLSANIAQAYADRAGSPAMEWRSAMKKETWFNAADAVKAGLADRIIRGKGAKKPAQAHLAVKTRPSAALLNKEGTMPNTSPDEAVIGLNQEQVDQLTEALQFEELDAQLLVDTVVQMAKSVLPQEQTSSEESTTVANMINDARAEAQAHWLVSTWIKEGRFSPSLKDKVTRLATVDPQLAMDSYGSRPANSIPMSEIGHSVSPEKPAKGTGKKWVR